jgi:hypothetical protein
MNRIRKTKNGYQVLHTPDIKISSDNALLLGNLEDENLRNFYITEHPTINQAHYISLQEPDIDWYRITLNHTYIYHRLDEILRNILTNSGINVQYIPNLMNGDELKNNIFERVLIGGNRFSFKYGVSDIISFYIVNPWFSNLDYLSKKIEKHRTHLYRNDLRIRNKQIINDKIIRFTGMTEFGSIYEIVLIPTLLYNYNKWYQKIGHTNNSDYTYRKILQQQNKLDQGVVIR